MKSFLNLMALGLFCLASYSQAQPWPPHYMAPREIAEQSSVSSPPTPLHPPFHDWESDFPQPVELIDHFFDMVKNGGTDKVKILINAGIGPNVCNRNGLSPLMLGVSIDRAEVVQILIDAGADLNNACGRDGISLIILGAINGSAKSVQILIGAGADPNARDRDGFTALMEGAYMNRTEVVKILLDAGVDPNASNNNGETSLYLAMFAGHTEVIQILRDAGATL